MPNAAIPPPTLLPLSGAAISGGDFLCFGPAALCLPSFCFCQRLSARKMWDLDEPPGNTLLTGGEELAAQGDLAARNVLIERNLRLVAHIMKKYYTQSADQEDLISIGTIGLIKGISTFDASKGARLATYAARCVENAILSQRNKRRLRWKTMNLLGQNGLCSAA